MNFKVVENFEKEIANFFGAPYAVALDSCTHGIELCLRYLGTKKIIVPVRTYVSIPFLANKIGIELEWTEKKWSDYYFLTDEVSDAAVLWKKGSYIKVINVVILANGIRRVGSFIINQSILGDV